MNKTSAASRGVITLSRAGARRALELELDWRDLLRAGIVPPMVGAEDPPPADPPPADPPPSDPPPAPKDDWTPPSREEYERLQQAAAEANKAKRELERKAEAARKKAAQDAGNYEELYNGANTELERTRSVVKGSAVRGAVSDVATTLGFRNPTLAASLIELDGVDADLDVDKLEATVPQAARAVIERRLKTVAERDPYLLDPGRTRQLPGAGGGGGGTDANGNAAMNAAIRRAAGRTS